MITFDLSSIPEREIYQASAPSGQLRKNKNKQKCLETVQLFALLGAAPGVSKQELKLTREF